MGPQSIERKEHIVKQQFGIAVAVFAIVAGGSIALAEDGDPPADEPTDTTVPLDEVDEPADDTDAVEVEVDDEVDDDADDEADVPDAEGEADNHGAVVSQAAHECETGPGGVHGECVSAVARDHDQDGIPDHGPGSPGFGDDSDDEGTDDATVDDGGDAEQQAPARGNGRGHGRGHG